MRTHESEARGSSSLRTGKRYPARTFECILLADLASAMVTEHAVIHTILTRKTSSTPRNNITGHECSVRSVCSCGCRYHVSHAPQGRVSSSIPIKHWHTVPHNCDMVLYLPLLLQGGHISHTCGRRYQHCTS
jgi:hypothetical protein